MKKRILTLLAALTLLLAGVLPLCSCSCRGETDVHVFYYTYSDPYISSVRAALDSKLSGASLSYQDYDANGNQTTQTEQIRTAITKGARALLVNVVNTGSDDAA